MSALPVVAISSCKRRFGLVCLSPRLTVIRAKLRCLHRCTTRTSQIVAIRHAIEDIVEITDTQTLVVEDEVDARRALRLGKCSIIPWVEEAGLKVVHMSCARACYEICGESDLRIAAVNIATRYAHLASEVLDERGKFCPRSERWRLRRPLVTAFVLAHAFASRSVIKAFGGLIPPHPQSRNYD